MDNAEGWGLLKTRKPRSKVDAKQIIERKILEVMNLFHHDNLVKCNGLPSMLKKNCNFDKQNTELHTNTLCNILNHLFTVLKHLKYLFWFSLCLPWDFNFWIITMDQTHLHTHFSYIGHAFECFKYLFWFCLSKVQAINRAGYVFQD